MKKDFNDEELKNQFAKCINKDFYYRNAITKCKYSTSIYILLGALCGGVPFIVGLCVCSQFFAVQSIWGLLFFPALLIGAVGGWIAKHIDISLFNRKIKKNNVRTKMLYDELKQRNIEVDLDSSKQK